MFSTDIVHFLSESTEFSTTALSRWLQVTLPLTFVTLLAFYFGTKLPVINFTKRSERADQLEEVVVEGSESTELPRGSPRTESIESVQDIDMGRERKVEAPTFFAKAQMTTPDVGMEQPRKTDFSDRRSPREKPPSYVPSTVK